MRALTLSFLLLTGCTYSVTQKEIEVAQQQCDGFGGLQYMRIEPEGNQIVAHCHNQTEVKITNPYRGKNQ